MEEYTVKSVDKACMLMEIISDYEDGVGITELAEKVGMYKSTVHRLLNTLAARGYIEQDPGTGKYKLGYRVLDLGMKLLTGIDLRRESAPFLHKLAMESNEVVHLAVLDHGEIVYIDKVESSNTTRMHSRVGKRVPVHGTGLGKAILAFLPPSEAVAIIDRYGLKPITPYTITDRNQLLDALDETRKLGYALDIEENEIEVCCVAAPIWDYNNKVVAAISVSGPSFRMTHDRLQEMVPFVTQTAYQISERLGYRGFRLASAQE
ncbi:IclR family transcriptional regulator [Fodinisporobacter ferrooxydans]|uniref:IclR family transcriptional regulator n=1 Tax=Fodinisporobacter ferrooxydans TaxID=2901836 RepID=A0ABY4CLH1_9BACL|nr:IclR family transcriptional regulator [Alicyclobacillaceae bacterium MYW30-H2]